MTKKSILGLFLFLSACQNAAVDPWRYTSTEQSKSYAPPVKEMRKIAEVLLQESRDFPKQGQTASLADLFDIGLRNSPHLAEVWQEAREAAAAYGESLADYYPNFSFEAYLLSQRIGYVFGPNDVFQSSTATAYGPLILFNYTIWDSGLRDAQSETSLQALNYANWTHSQSIQMLLQEIASSFYNHLYSKALLEAYEQDLVDADQNYLAANENFQFGIKDITDVLQAKTKFLEKEIRVTDQLAIVDNSFIHLLKVTGIPTGAIFQLPPFPDSAPFQALDVSMDQLIQIAKEHRPEYLAAKADVLSKEANVKAQKAEVYPEIEVSGNGGQTWYTTGATDNGTYTVQLNLTFPIFAGFQYQNQIKQAEAALKGSVSNLRVSELNLTSDVRTGYNNFDAAKKQLKMTKEYLEAAEKEYAAVFARYRQGTIDILDLFSAEASLSDARARNVQAKRDLFVSIVNLTFATGTLCKN